MYPVVVLLFVQINKAATEERSPENQKKIRKNGTQERVLNNIYFVLP